MNFPIRLILIAVALILGISAPYIFKKNDAVVEEISEEIIRYETGVDIDFSPDGAPDTKSKRVAAALLSDPSDIN